MSDQATITRFLHTVPMFEGLQDKQLQRLAKRFTERAFNAGETIVTQGTLGIGLFVIESGKADAIRQLPDGSSVTVNKFGSTDFFGELSLLDDAPRTASVVATEATKCLVLTQLDFNSVLREDADIPIIMLRELAKALPPHHGTHVVTRLTRTSMSNRAGFSLSPSPYQPLGMLHFIHTVAITQGCLYVSYHCDGWRRIHDGAG
jgi:CRP/FNR family cyclic AMP-dependent transcriptional regulator